MCASVAGNTALAIDASSMQGCSIALLAKGKVYCEINTMPRQQASVLQAMLRSVCGKAGISLRAIDRVAFGCGPGSFTGLRIACSVTQGVSFALGIDVVPVSSLRILAQQVHQVHKMNEADIVLDARMGEFYYGRYALQGELMTLQGEECLLSKEQMLQKIDTAQCVVADSECECASLKITMPSAEYLLPFIESIPAVKPEQALPVYLRGRDAWMRSAHE